MAGKACCVVCDGPFPTTDWEGEEIPEWVVAVEDEDGNEVGNVYRVFSHSKAVNLAMKIARDRKLELVDESMRA